MRDRISASVRTCLANGLRLLDDAELLELNEPPTTSYFLAMIAQEEFAKGFLLAMVVRDVIPWDRRLIRAARDHACKQLLCVVMDYLVPDTDDWLERVDAILRGDFKLDVPRKVTDALNILRHEKIGRWVKNSWFWDEEPVYDRSAMAISNGKQDRRKQDALYVRLSANGGIASTPSGVTLETVRVERERGGRLARLTQDLLDGEPHPGMDYPTIEELFRALFSSMVAEESVEE